MRSIEAATAAYEQWLGAHTSLVTSELRKKHEMMSAGPFPFLRGTFYRWLESWGAICPQLNQAPVVMAVGDLHIENFGTWRDTEGRLTWGINDFDEACRLPYTQDLLRLATSALLAIESGQLSVKRGTACDCILDGYGESVRSGGGPFVLAERNSWLGMIAVQQLKDPRRFWDKLLDCPPIAIKKVPLDVMRIFKSLLPQRDLRFRILTRQAGLGSRGRQRFVLAFECNGGQVAREAKALVPPYASWLRGRTVGKTIYSDILNRAIRNPDHTVRVIGMWLLRRLAPDCTKLEIGMLPTIRNEERMLWAMGFETGNIHLGSGPKTQAIITDLKTRHARWLHDGAKQMAKFVTDDWKQWAKRHQRISGVSKSKA